MDIISPIIAFVLSCSLVRYMLPYVMLLSLRKRLIDPIDSRKVHNVPASRLGGFTFLPSVIFAVMFSLSAMGIYAPEMFAQSFTPNLTFEISALLLLYLIGIFDDIIGVRYRRKFVVQIIAALLVVASGAYFKSLNGIFGIYEISPYLGVPITIFFYVFVTNSINLIDGIDGLASLLSIMALIVYGVLLYLGGFVVDNILAYATIGALLPFCYSNIMGLRPSFLCKIFMGDAGALVIGAVLGFLAVKLWNVSGVMGAGFSDSTYYILVYTMLVVPCFDVVRIVIHRFKEHKPIFQPDKNHIHHKLMAVGLTARQALLFIIAINLIFLVMNLLLHYVLGFMVIVAINIILWTVFHIYLSRKIERI